VDTSFGRPSHLEFTGTLAVLNGCLPLMVFTPDANYNGKDYHMVTLRVDDMGSGHGLASRHVATELLTVDIDAINDAPVAVGPTDNISVGLDRMAPYRGFSVSDVDYQEGWGALLKITIESVAQELTTSGFTFYLGNTNGCSFSEGTPGPVAAERFVIKCAHWNANNALRGIHIIAKDDSAYCNTKSRLVMTVDDQGNTGISGAALTASVSRDVTITCKSEL